ncbi:MAG: large subunit ribosomal protein L10 [Microgenomates group bacterium Gr01-1014_80]|nr:MAG: large subunit ribosomal protein L10 [Microgenomates group bacterium Gr01-1014_80]
MAKTRQQKEEDLSKLKDKFGRAKSVVFADYRGLNMKQLSELRNKLHDQDAEFTVTKNTLLERAFPGIASSPSAPRNDVIASERSSRGNLFNGPTATLFAYDDEISPIKLLVKALKDAGIGKVKSGLLGTESLDEFKVNQLAELPAKDELRAKTVGVLAAPLQGIVGVLQANLRNLVYALSEIQKAKGGV